MGDRCHILSLDALSLAAARVDRSPDRINLEIGDSARLDKSLVEGEMGSQIWADPVTFSAALSRLLKPLRSPLFGPDELLVVFSDSLVRTHFLKLDNLDPKNLKPEFVRFRIQKALEEELKSSPLFDFFPLSEKAGVVTFLAHSIPQEFLNEFKEILEKLGWVLQGCAPASTSLWNLVEKSDSPAGGTSILIDAGLEITTMTFFRQGVPEYLRVIEVAGQHMIQEFSDLQTVPAGEARERLFTEALLPGASRDDFAAGISRLGNVSRVFGNWFRELTLTLQFYFQHFPGLEPREVLLAGELARVPNLTPILTKLFGLPVRPLLPAAARFQLPATLKNPLPFLPILGRAAGLEP